MSRKLLAAFLFLVIAVPAGSLIAQGAEVVLALKDGRRVDGELLSVRDSSIVLSTNMRLSEHDLTELADLLVVVRSEEILHVIIKGKSNILSGMGEGLLLGGAIGGALGLLTGDDKSGFIRFTAAEKAGWGAIGFGAVGLIIGTITGIASSTSDKMIEPLPDFDFSLLKQLARYKTGEPEFLKTKLQ